MAAGLTRPPVPKATAVSIIAMAFALGACSNGKAANEDNFRRVLEPVVADKFCRYIDVERLRLTQSTDLPAWPIVIPAEPMRYGDDGKFRAMLGGAASEGMLTATRKTAPATQPLSAGPLEPTAVISYAPTDKGKSVFRTIERKGDAIPVMCMGTGKIDKIVRWTEPADAFGQIMTQVTYTYSATDLPVGVPDAIKQQAKDPVEAKSTLVRIDGGWQVAN